MEINDLLKDVNDINDYVSVTQDIATKKIALKVSFNTTTIVALKKIQSLEIKYFAKFEKNGVAALLFDYMLQMPSSKTWFLLGKEIIYVLEYWLGALTKSIIDKTACWWTFLNTVLRFLGTICTKDSSLCDELVERTGGALLELATKECLDIFQRLEVLRTFNYCSTSTCRELRLALKEKLNRHFVKLSAMLVHTAHMPSQFTMVETLVRWMVKRQQRAVRLKALSEWMPSTLYANTAREVFLERSWMNFFQDAREFLNAQNEKSDVVTSVVCKKVTVGANDILTGTERRKTWMDINQGDKSISILLTSHGENETLIVTEEITVDAKMYRESHVVLSIVTSEPPFIFPTPDFIKGLERNVKITIASNCDVTRVDRALRGVFSEKYKVLTDLTKLVDSPTSEESFTVNSRKKGSQSEEDTRFSNPVARKKHSGYSAHSRGVTGCKSPSTASTSSLALLHEKLAALPRFDFDKEPVSVCAQPNLSNVTELTENTYSTASTLKLRNYGVKAFFKPKKQFGSDGEYAIGKTKLNKCISPVIVDENSTSCLLEATLGSVDKSILNNTIEQLPKDKNVTSENIVDLLVQEALKIDDNNSEVIENTQFTENHKKKEILKPVRKIITKVDDSSEHLNAEVIEETPRIYVNTRRKYTRDKNVDIADKQKTAATCEHSNIISIDRTNKQEKETVKVYKPLDDKIVEEFFAQHIRENEVGDIVISPTLAKKINESSSESNDEVLNDDFNNQIINKEPIVNENEILECLNSVLDEVCSELEKVTNIFNRKEISFDSITDSQKGNIKPSLLQSQELNNIITQKNIIRTKNKTKSVTSKSVNTRSKKKGRAKKSINKNTVKLNLKGNVPKMSTIIEDKYSSEENFQDENNDNHDAKNINPVTISEESLKPDKSTPLLTRKKRKLYSPNDAKIQFEKRYVNIPETEDDDSMLSKSNIYKENVVAPETPYTRYNAKQKSTDTPASCYKEIKSQQKKRIREPRLRKSIKIGLQSSPRTQKNNDLFDQIKEQVNNNENILLVDKKSSEKDIRLYNYSSESEEDFKTFKPQVQKKASNTTLVSFESSVSKRGRSVSRINYAESKPSSADEDKQKLPKKQKKTTKPKKTRTRKVVEPVIGLINEKMREATVENLNTSMIKEVVTDEIIEVPEPAIAKHAEMEMIASDGSNGKFLASSNDTKTSKRSKKDKLTLKKDEYKKKQQKLEIIKDKSSSPLPGLVVETMPVITGHAADDSVSVNMLEKMKNILNNVPLDDTNDTQKRITTADCNFSNIKEHLNEGIVTDITNYENIPINKNQEKKKTSQLIKNIKKEIFTSQQKQNTKDDNENEIIDLINQASTKIPEKNRSNEVIDISDTVESQNNPVRRTMTRISDRSIATEGITAHCDSDQDPPCPESLATKLQPRNLDIEYHSEITKDFFARLNKNTSITNQSSSDDRTEEIDTNKEISKKVSPTVKLTRLSPVYISKYLSGKSSISGSDVNEKLPDSKPSPEIKSKPKRRQMNLTYNNSQLLKKLKYKTEKTKRQTTNTIQSKGKVKKFLTIQRLPSLCDLNLDENSQHSDRKSDKNKTDDDTNGNSQKIVSLSKEDSLDTISSGRILDKFRKSTAIEMKCSGSVQSDSQHTLKFDTPLDLSPCIVKVQKLIFSPRKTNKKRTLSPEAEKVDKRRKKNVAERVLLESYPSKSSVDDFTKNIPKSKNLFIANLNQTNVSSNEEIPRKMPLSPREQNINKTQKRNVKDVILESRSSKSSVDDWIRRNIPESSRAESAHASMRDSLESVLERLDTTLLEIHRNTNQRFVKMFVDQQEELTRVREERQKEYETAKEEIMAATARAVDQKFAELNQKTEQQEKEFQEKFKQRACELLREDCKHKQAMVSILREDVQNFMDHVRENDM